jgi:hypothetical protein
MAAKMKRIKDIRYFEAARVPASGEPIHYDTPGLFDLPKDIHRLGQRIACLLEVQGFSAGSADHVYVTLTTALSGGETVPIGLGFERWQLYVACGLSNDFKSLPPSQKLTQLEALTFDALAALNPREASLLTQARRSLEAGASTRVLRASKETKAFRFEVWFDVPSWQGQSYLYVVARDNKTGSILEAPPFPLASYEHAFPLVSSIAFSKGVVKLVPRKSFRADLSTGGYSTPLLFPLSRFVVAHES